MQSMTKYDVGQYVTTLDGLTGFVFEIADGALTIAICEHDEERTVPASDVSLWMPRGQEAEPRWS